MQTKKKILVAFLLNLFFSVFELIGGIFTGSVAIISDAVHDFGDAISIGLSFIFEKVGERQPDEKFTYGYGRFSVLGGLITTVILLISSGVVIYNAILRMINPTPVHQDGMLIFAVVGLVVNLFATIFTHGGKSINQRAVNLHMLEDVLGWAIVLVGAIVMRFTGWYIIDPILSVAVAIFVLVNCAKNLKDVLDIFLLKTPKNIAVEKVIEAVRRVEGAVDVHHVHVWTLDGEGFFATLHVVADGTDVKTAVKEALRGQGVSHATVEMESLQESCTEKECAINRRKCSCGHHHGHRH